LCYSHYPSNYPRVLAGKVMLGYAITDLDDMISALDSVLTTINSDDDPWLYNNTWRAKEFLQGLEVEGYFENA